MKPHLYLLAWRRLLWGSAIFTLLVGMTACGSGGGGASGSHPIPDFTLSVSPTNQSVNAGGQASISLSATGINGFSSQISVQVSGVPAGVTVSPSNLTLAPGTPQQVTFTARTDAVSLNGTVTFTGGAGLFIHTSQLALAVNGFSSDVPLRTRYRRTDATTEYFLWLNQHWILYHASTGRYFMADTSSNQVQVVDAVSQQKIATIPVPGAFGMDDTPDHRTIYVGTQLGDVYAIDPFAMIVTQRYIGSEIGPTGYLTSSVQVLADGRLALIGPYNGVDGTSSIAVWNPSDNSLTVYGAYGGQGTEPCDLFTNFGGFTRTVDRSHILLGTYGSDRCALDPSNGTYVTSAGGQNSTLMFPTPDGRYIILPSYYPFMGAVVLDAHTLATVAQFPTMGDTGSDAAFVISPDSKTLYVPSQSIIYAYDIASGQLVGWPPNLHVPTLSGGVAFGPPFGPNLQATDGSGVFAGPMEEGIAFVDLSVLNAGPVGTQFADGELITATGPSSGGTATQWRAPGVLAPLSYVYFGLQQATAISYSSDNIFATSPPGNAGPVDVYTFVADGGMQVLPEAFSYGPTILEVTPNTATAEGGGTGSIYGYGFGPTNSGTIPAGLQVAINGVATQVTAFSGCAYPVSPAPFPLQSIAYVIPAGVSGTAVDVSVTTSAGSATAAGALTYLGPIQQFHLPGATLAQGIYDPHRDVYYFTDATEVRVFSRSQRQWLASIPITPPPGTTENLWGIALSPDGSKLAVSDATAGAIYVLDPSNPASVQTFIVGSRGFYISNPCGLAISDAGNVYYMVFGPDINGGIDQFFKLDTNTGDIHDYGLDGPGRNWEDAYLRNAITSDNAAVFLDEDGEVFRIDTATDQWSYAPDGFGCCYGNYELALSSNQTQLTATDYIYDSDLNGESYYALNDREVLNIAYVYGAKLSPDGRLLFQPSLNGIDVLDGSLGNLRTRISLPVALSPNYDALVIDTSDNVLIAITGQQGDGIAIIDLTSIAEPPPLPYDRTREARPHRFSALSNGDSRVHTSGTKEQSRPATAPRTIPRVRRGLRSRLR